MDNVVFECGFRLRDVSGDQYCLAACGVCPVPAAFGSLFVAVRFAFDSDACRFSVPNIFRFSLFCYAMS